MNPVPMNPAMLRLQQNLRPAGMPNAAPAAPQQNAAAIAASQRSQKIRDAMRTGKIGGKNNKIPVGTGWFLVKQAQYKITDTQGLKMTAFSLLCIRGIADGQGLKPEAPMYTGPKAGEVYDYAIFHETKYPEMLGKQYLRTTAVCLGWTEDQLASYQQTPDGFDIIAEMTENILCADVDGNQAFEVLRDAMGKPIVDAAGRKQLAVDPVSKQPIPLTCILNNQVVLEISRKVERKDKKVDGQVAYDATGSKIQIDRDNTYLNKRIWLSDVQAAGLLTTEAEVIKAFGSVEAFNAAVETEKAFRGI